MENNFERLENSPFNLSPYLTSNNEKFQTVLSRNSNETGSFGSWLLPTPTLVAKLNRPFRIHQIKIAMGVPEWSGNTALKKFYVQVTNNLEAKDDSGVGDADWITVIHQNSWLHTSGLVAFNINLNILVKKIRIVPISFNHATYFDFAQFHVIGDFNTDMLLIRKENTLLSTSVINGEEINLIPIMTSNTLPSGVASASSVYRNMDKYNPWKALDGVNDLEGWVGAENANEYWLRYDFSESKLVNYYAITTTNGPYRGDPHTWIFEGSNDGVLWNEIHAIQNEPLWDLDERREYDFDTTIYKCFRISIKGFHSMSGVNYMSIGVFEIGRKPYKQYKISGAVESQDFISYGADSIDILADVKEIANVIKISSTTDGIRVFSHKIDLDKYRVNSIEI